MTTFTIEVKPRTAVANIALSCAHNPTAVTPAMQCGHTPASALESALSCPHNPTELSPAMQCGHAPQDAPISPVLGCDIQS